MANEPTKNENKPAKKADEPCEIKNASFKIAIELTEMIKARSNQANEPNDLKSLMQNAAIAIVILTNPIL